MYSKNYKIFVIVLVSLVLFSFVSCGESEKPGASKRKIRQVSGTEKQFQDAMEKMESLKADIEKYDDIYRRAVAKSRSILDQREAKIAAEECLRYSKALNQLCSGDMNNTEVISRVSGSSDTYRDYMKFSEKMIKKYESILKQ